MFTRMFKIFRPSDHERRTTSRIPFDLIIGYAPADSPGNADTVFAKCLDISTGGMLFSSMDRFNEGALLHVEFPVPGRKESIQVEAEVVRVRQSEGKYFEMGVKFRSLTPEEASSIKKLVECYKINTDLEV